MQILASGGVVTVAAVGPEVARQKVGGISTYTVGQGGPCRISQIGLARRGGSNTVKVAAFFGSEATRLVG